MRNKTGLYITIKRLRNKKSFQILDINQYLFK